jgi:hypothetical protein
MRFHSSNVFGVIVVACAMASGAWAQDQTAEAPAHLAIVDGAATLDREDVSEPAASGTPLVPGDRLRTERGRAEVLFPDGSALAVDEYSVIELQASALLRVLDGRVILVVTGADRPESAGRFQIDTPAASVNTYGPGEYRISLSGRDGDQVELAVVRGSASLVTDGGSIPLRAGERTIASAGALPLAPQFFNSARYDAFERWATQHRDARMSSLSAQYLPSDLRMYGGTLDRHGSWEYESQYGYVWYPTVGADWRPYYDGYWSPLPAYGWTWVGLELWSWPTHHYGRWGHIRNRWFWIPQRHWAPAWVSWGGAPGYVSWCPLDYHNRPVFGFSIASRHGWNAWTVVSRDHFGSRRHHAREYAVHPRGLPANAPFITHASAPAAPARAVPRRPAGGERSASQGEQRGSGVAVPRSPRGGAYGSVTHEPRYGSRPTEDDRRGPRSVFRQPGNTTAAQQAGPPGSVERSSGVSGNAGDRARSRDRTRSPIYSRGTMESRGSAGVPTDPNAPDWPTDRSGVIREPWYGGASRRAPGETSRPVRPRYEGAARPATPGFGGASRPATPDFGGTSRPAIPETPRGRDPWYGDRPRSAAPRSGGDTPPASSPQTSAPPAAPRYDIPRESRRAPFSSPRYQRPESPPPSAAAPPPQSQAPQRSGAHAAPRGGDSRPAAQPREHSRSRR